MKFLLFQWMMFPLCPIGCRESRENPQESFYYFRHSLSIFSEGIFFVLMCNSHTFPVFNATYAAFFPQPLARKLHVRQKGPYRQRNTSRAGTSLYCVILAENLFFTKTVIVYSTIRPYLQKSIPLIKAKGMEPLGQTFKAKEAIGLCIKQKNRSIGVTCHTRYPSSSLRSSILSCVVMIG